MKDALACFVPEMLTIAELPQGGIVNDADRSAGHLDRKVEIADEPAEAGGLGSLRGQGDFEDGLGLLLDDVIGGVVLKEDVAVVQRVLKVEAEFRAIGGNPAPAAFGQRGARDRKRRSSQSVGPVMEMVVDDLHGG